MDSVSSEIWLFFALEGIGKSLSSSVATSLCSFHWLEYYFPSLWMIMILEMDRGTTSHEN
ncbi:hypothetical protein MUK42_12992 [Musa troglodytarum]|uniref:Uncharacterized protein n=1 Tax=Musa troglodytarum TaxID=320322 RepID=A0A9E7HCN8_9LILI|nr:hypothetical protein MUK42_12992 [Musa troglodytarum]URE27653.1 hypothetical protein MUK42_12992 [Musa troglodytarum]URE27654.1 hypothetical protein MUK42_12992 [Musa troglodytarum]URE27664.1 hypothetical protein MUK42_12992 [Musa troglodytarum]URE27665.1 hypothetical protein MUK42_12992 [Musa troglodytarum]